MVAKRSKNAAGGRGSNNRSATTGITPRQQRFVDEYLVDLNATQAATRAGYSARTANEQGARLLAKASVQEAIAAKQQRLAIKCEISAERVLEEYRRIAFADPRAVLAWGPEGVKLRPSDDLKPEEAALVSEVSETKDGMRIKLHSKLDALGSLAKHLGLFKEAPDVNVTLNHLEVNVTQVMQELDEVFDAARRAAVDSTRDH